MKAVSKLRKELLKTLQSLQLHFDIKASMLDDDDDYDQVAEESDHQKIDEQNKKETKSSVNDLKSFSHYVTKIMIEPFGGRLFQSLHDIATELDLPDKLISALKRKAESVNGTQRRNSRKPATPSRKIKTPGKITPHLKKATLDKETQTDQTLYEYPLTATSP